MFHKSVFALFMLAAFAVAVPFVWAQDAGPEGLPPGVSVADESARPSGSPASQGESETEPSGPADTQFEQERVEFELVRMLEVAREASDYIDKRRDARAGARTGAPELDAGRRAQLQLLKNAIKVRDLDQARRAFRELMGALDETRCRLDEDGDRSSVAPRKARQGIVRATQRIAQATSRLTRRLDELKRLAVRYSIDEVDESLLKTSSSIRSLQQDATTGADVDDLRQRLRDLRSAVRAIERLIAQEMGA